jgi:hypothetical protein
MGVSRGEGRILDIKLSRGKLKNEDLTCFLYFFLDYPPSFWRDRSNIGCLLLKNITMLSDLNPD